MLGNRQSQHDFARPSARKPDRSRFNRSFALKGTYNFDRLNPIFVDEVVAGDITNLNVKTFLRLATQKVPIMDNIYVDFFFFFVPSRLVWDNWEKFFGAKLNAGDSTSYLVPQIQTGADPEFGVQYGSVAEMMGIPPKCANLSFSALPFRALQLIWNEWFRAAQIQTAYTIPMGDGPDSLGSFANAPPPVRGKRHDYFTSALPSPQAGPSIGIPLGTGFVVGNGTTPSFNSTAGTQPVFIHPAGGFNNLLTGGTLLGADDHAPTWNNTGMALSTNALGTINQLREAFQMQVFMEAENRGGQRYTEILTQHFNVVAQDFRLQRPEYLGGGSLMMNTHPVAQTSQTDTDSPQANLAAFATASHRGAAPIGFTKSFPEPGYVIGLMNFRADITYQQGLQRFWSRRTRFDFFWPEFQNIGEQAILNQEIWCEPTTGSSNSGVFGYQERHGDYRYYPSLITGEFRSQNPDSLDFWHLAQEFESLPTLNGDFIASETPIERAIAVTDAPHVLGDFFFNYIQTRPMVTYAVPMSLGRF